MNLRGVLIVGVVLVVLVVLAVLFLASRSLMSPGPSDLEVSDGRLAPCPDSPNCVSSQATDEEHGIEPLPLHGDLDRTRSDLVAAIEGMSGARVVSSEGSYVHAEYTSRLFRFVDDVVLWIAPDASRVEVRSASRTGYSDLGANRKRVEALRAAFAARADGP